MSLRISWLVPAPVEGSGGHRNIFRVVRQLSDFGHQLTLYFDPGTKFRDEHQLEDFLRMHFFALKAKIVIGLERSVFDDCDALFATHFPTAYVVRSNMACRKKFYFVQDFEPMFYPMGADYLMAENTYRMGLIGITAGPWCAKILRERYGMDADYVQFPVDREIYYPRSKQARSSRRVLFFARPEMPRRCYSLGLEAFKVLHEMMSDVEILLYGSKQINSNTIPFPHQNLGVLAPDALASLYSNADAGIAFSTTNPSLVPYEMMACGLPVLDIDRDHSAEHYGGKENACLVAPDPNSVAENLASLLQDDVRMRFLSEAGLRYVARFPNEELMSRRVESLIVRALTSENVKTAMPEPKDIAPEHQTGFGPKGGTMEFAGRNSIVEENKESSGADLSLRLSALDRQVRELRSLVQTHHDFIVDLRYSTTLRILFMPARIARKLMAAFRSWRPSSR